MTDNSYEELYNVGLLDDLHNFFPAILYNPEQFESVQQLLAYISSQTRHRFNLFNRGMRRYQNINSNINSNITSTPNPTISEYMRQRMPDSENISSPTVLQPNPSSSQPRNTGLNITFPQNGIPIESYNLSPRSFLNIYAAPGNDISSILRDILNLNTILRPDALEPVVVAPTQQQISTATTTSEIGEINDLTEQICSICQEGYTRGQTIRKITSCNHIFHKDCLDRWFGRNVRCPICRHDIRETSGQTQPS